MNEIVQTSETGPATLSNQQGFTLMERVAHQISLALVLFWL
jgi:hypothetical protein